MDKSELEEHLRRQIPLSAAMEIAVREAAANSIVLSAPLKPNINHMQTVFGGSAPALAILAAWSLVHVRLADEGFKCAVVIQSNHMDYDRPIAGCFTAVSFLSDGSDWPNFMRTLRRRRLARIEVQSVLRHEDAVAGRFTGRFVAFLENEE